MKLFHAFPRPKHRIENGKKILTSISRVEASKKGLEILKLILECGLLCTPERFRLYPNYATENPEKKAILNQGGNHDEIVQSRACFTLAESIDLSKEYVTALNGKSYTSHSESFGEFAIGLDPIEAREFGVLPTVYFYRQDIFSSARRTAGLGAQIVERLDEIRTVFSILSFIEAKANSGGNEHPQVFPSEQILREMGIGIKYQDKILKQLHSLKLEEAKAVYDLFDSDRSPAWNLVDFLKIMLSLYQTTDSTIDDSPLAFFHQREWRLVHHMMSGMNWFSLGSHPMYRDHLVPEFRDARNTIKKFLERQASALPASYYNNCWVFSGTSKIPFRNFIKEIVVPEECVVDAGKLVDSFSFLSEKPSITVLPVKWRIKLEDGKPTIKF
jgi:hypothetical protein